MEECVWVWDTEMTWRRFILGTMTIMPRDVVESFKGPFVKQVMKFMFQYFLSFGRLMNDLLNLQVSHNVR